MPGQHTQNTKKEGLLALEGYVMRPQDFSVNDGDGIRTTVFLAGCPLSCAWCSNPESWAPASRVSFNPKVCIGCGACVAACPSGVGIDLNKPEERARCTSSGACVDACPTGARSQLVKKISLEDLVREVEATRIFQAYSGGGITLSGGEPSFQLDFFKALVKALYDRGHDLALESSAYFDYEEVLPSLRLIGTIFIDIKHMDPEVHRAFTGLDNDLILSNLKKMGQDGLPVIVRIPMIGGVNADRENIRATGDFVAQHLPQAGLEILPYHTYGEGKYQALGLDLPPDSFKTPTDEEVREAEDIIRQAGVEVLSFK